MRALSPAVLAFSFAFTLSPCCEALADSLLPSSMQHGNDRSTHDGAPDPCAWMDASDVALPVLSVAGSAGGSVIHSHESALRSVRLIVAAVLPHGGSSRGPPRPLYLELLRLRL